MKDAFRKIIFVCKCAFIMTEIKVFYLRLYRKRNKNCTCRYQKQHSKESYNAIYKLIALGMVVNFVRLSKQNKISKRKQDKRTRYFVKLLDNRIFRKITLLSKIRKI